MTRKEYAKLQNAIRDIRRNAVEVYTAEVPRLGRRRPFKAVSLETVERHLMYAGVMLSERDDMNSNTDKEKL